MYTINQKSATLNARISPIFDSAAVECGRMMFGNGVFTDRTRRFQPTPQMERERLALLDADRERELEDRFLAYQAEDQAAGLLTDADLIAAGVAVG